MKALSVNIIRLVLWRRFYSHVCAINAPDRTWEATNFKHAFFDFVSLGSCGGKLDEIVNFGGKSLSYPTNNSTYGGFIITAECISNYFQETARSQES